MKAQLSIASIAVAGASGALILGFGVGSTGWGWLLILSAFLAGATHLSED
jgi:hypothetical protein